MSPPYRLLILACSDRKKNGPEYMDAIERYNGPLWQTLRATKAANPGAFDNLAVMFLSAKYGFRAADHAIEVYNDRLTPEIVEDMISGEIFVRAKHGIHQRYHGLSRNELSDLQESIRYRYETRYAEQFVDVCLVGGWLYLWTMRYFLQRWQAPGRGLQDVSPNARVTEINGSIGKMRQAMKAWMCDTTHVSCTKLD